MGTNASWLQQSEPVRWDVQQQKAKWSAPTAHKSCIPQEAQDSYSQKVSDHLGPVDLSTPAPSMRIRGGYWQSKYAAFIPATHY